jgi:hypothetical protein
MGDLNTDEFTIGAVQTEGLIRGSNQGVPLGVDQAGSVN